MGDILGRVVPPSWQLRSSRAVLVAACIKTKLLVILVPGILQPKILGGDLALAALVAVNWFMSGYINTGAYLLAPRLATLEAQGPCTGGSGWRFWGSRKTAKGGAGGASGVAKAYGGSGISSSVNDSRNSAALARIGTTALRSKSGAVMSFCFQSSCFLGLLGAWVVQELLRRSGHPAFAAPADKAAGAAVAAAAAAAAAAMAAEMHGAVPAGGAEGLGTAVSPAGVEQVLKGLHSLAANNTAAAAGGGGLAAAAGGSGGALSAAAAAVHIAASAAVAAGGQPAT